MLQVPNLVKSDLVFNERLTEFSVDIYTERVNQHLTPIIGSNIRRLQEERGMKSTEVIAKLQLMDINVTSGIYSKVLNGRNNPTVDMLIALKEIFNVNYDEFFKRKDD